MKILSCTFKKVEEVTKFLEESRAKIEGDGLKIQSIKSIQRTFDSNGHTINAGMVIIIAE